jgi:hypothetical protein
LGKEKPAEREQAPSPLIVVLPNQAETGPMAAAYLDLNLLFATPTKGSRRSIGEMKHRLFLIVVGGSIVASMMGWLYALGWVALKLVQFV